jgi:DNA-binding response OmpR family regulator
MSGRELARRIRDECAGVGVLYVSGYTADEFVRKGVPEPDAPFLQKPFTIEELELAVHDALLARRTCRVLSSLRENATVSRRKG